MGFGEPKFRVAFDGQPGSVQRPGKGLGVLHDLFWVRLLVVQHFVGRSQQAEQGAQVMVTHMSRERAPLDKGPQVLERGACADVAQDDATLWTEESLVRRARDDVGAFRERILIVPPKQPEHVCAVVHDQGSLRVVLAELAVDEFGDLLDGLLMNDDAATEHQ